MKRRKFCPKTIPYDRELDMEVVFLKTGLWEAYNAMFPICLDCLHRHAPTVIERA